MTRELDGGVPLTHARTVTESLGLTCANVYVHVYLQKCVNVRMCKHMHVYV